MLSSFRSDLALLKTKNPAQLQNGLVGLRQQLNHYLEQLDSDLSRIPAPKRKACYQIEPTEEYLNLNRLREDALQLLNEINRHIQPDSKANHVIMGLIVSAGLFAVDKCLESNKQTIILLAALIYFASIFRKEISIASQSLFKTTHPATPPSPPTLINFRNFKGHQ